jgi:hypothetical protein
MHQTHICKSLSENFLQVNLKVYEYNQLSIFQEENKCVINYVEKYSNKCLQVEMEDAYCNELRNLDHSMTLLNLSIYYRPITMSYIYLM